MGEGEKKGLPDALVLERIFPDAGALFAFAPSLLSEIKDTCLFVLDTNVLVLPYTTSRTSLASIRTLYKQLTNQKRLVVPGRVAREFARTRPEKLKELFQQLERRRDSAQWEKRQTIPVLTEIQPYEDVAKLEEDIRSAVTKYRDAIGKLLDHIRGWYWNDPVSLLYREIFVGEIVYDPPRNDQDILKDLTRHQVDNIPPGYKDSSKSDGGIGDLLIWRTILELGRSRKLPLVFVSGDNTADWWYKSESTLLYPRYELLDEYRRESEGKSFHIINLAELLDQFGAEKAVVEEIRRAEAASAPVELLASPQQRLFTHTERAAWEWAAAELAGTLVQLLSVATDLSGMHFGVKLRNGVFVTMRTGFPIRGFFDEARLVRWRPTFWSALAEKLQDLDPESFVEDAALSAKMEAAGVSAPLKLEVHGQGQG